MMACAGAPVHFFQPFPKYPNWDILDNFEKRGAGGQAGGAGGGSGRIGGGYPIGILGYCIGIPLKAWGIPSFLCGPWRSAIMAGGMPSAR
jgi:hypothetical protein